MSSAEDFKNRQSYTKKLPCTERNVGAKTVYKVKLHRRTLEERFSFTQHGNINVLVYLRQKIIEKSYSVY